MTSESLWHQYASLFRHLYIDENKTLKEVKQEAEEIHGFPSNSLSAYETRLRELLGLRKNLTPAGWRAIGEQIRSNGNRKWEVYVHGKMVSRRKVMKEVGRYEKHDSSSKNLPMPPEARIKWTDQSFSRTANRSIEEQHPQQMIPPVVSDSTPFASVITGPRYEDLEMVDCQSMISVTSSNDVLNEMVFLLYNRPGIIDETTDIALAARVRYSIHFCAAILDPRLKELWAPMLNNLPLFFLTQDLNQIFHKHFAPPLSIGFLPVLQIPHPGNFDSAQSMCSSHKTYLQGISNAGDIADDAGHIHRLSTNGTVSAGFDPLQILGQLIYYLSNHFEGLENVEDTMIFLMEKASLNFVGDFLRAGSPAIEESWMELAEWSFELGEKKFFELVMQVSLNCQEWVQLNGTRCLAFAANLGCTEIVSTIIELGVSPNGFSYFSLSRDWTSATPQFSKLAAVELHRIRYPKLKKGYLTTCPLLEAAFRSRLDILEILKDAHADCYHRLDGLTTAGHVIFAHQHELIDVDDFSLTLPFLLSMGEEVDAPIIQHELDFYEEPGKSRLDLPEETSLWSDETLLDAIYLTIGDSYLFKEAQERSQIPPGVLTVTGILQSANAGHDALRHYMSTVRYPSGLPRRRIEEIALVRSLKLPEAFKSMMTIGFNLEFKTLKSHDTKLLGEWSSQRLSRRLYSGKNHIEVLLDELADLPALVSQFIVDQLTDEEISSRIHQMSGSNIAALITNSSAGLLQRFGTELLELAVEANEYDAVEACLQAGVSPQEIDILKFARSAETNQSIFVLLHNHGAQLALSPHNQNSMVLEELSRKMLKWLMSQLSDLDGELTCDIVMMFLHHEIDWEDSNAFGQWLLASDYCKNFRKKCRHVFSSERSETYKDWTSSLLALLLCLGGSMQLVLHLLDDGIDLNSRRIITPGKKDLDVLHVSVGSPMCRSELEVAVRDCNMPLVQRLLDRGDDINHCNSNGETPLEIAVKRYAWKYDGNCDSEESNVLKQLIITLLENGADVNFEHYRAFQRIASPSLEHAVKSDTPDLQLIQLLLEKGARADTNHQSCSWGCTLLSYVLADKEKDLQLKKEIFALLLAHGAKYDKYSELRIASQSGDIELVRFHLDNGADPNDTSQPKEHYMDKSPLEQSAGDGNIPLALILLAAGASLAGEDHSLSGAAGNGRLDMVSLLLPHEKRLEEVERALECAVGGRFYSIVQLLRQAKTNWEA